MTKLIKTASNVKIYGYSFKSRSRKNILKEANENALFTTIPKEQDIVAKRHLVLKSNPLFYALGETLKPTNHYTKEYQDGQD
jgi:hypothetical protein